MSDEYVTKQTKVKLPTSEGNLEYEILSILDKGLKRRTIIGVE